MTLFRDDLNDTIAQIQVSTIRQFDEEVSAIPDMVKLTLGEPDFNTPQHVKDAAKAAIDQNFSHYTGMAGLLELRQAAANFQAKKYGNHYDAEDQVLVTVGATEAIATALTTICNPGDAIIIPSPIFPAYIPIIQEARATPLFMDTGVNDFVITPKMVDDFIAAHPNEHFKGIVLNYPNNPTGVTYVADEIEALAACFKRHNLWVVSDEIYSELTYGSDHVSIANYLPDETILINGLSKSHAMTGWRIGFLFASKELTAQMKKVHQYYVTAATTIAQKAGIEALTNGLDDALPMRAEYQKRRDFVYQTMNGLGFKIARPTGAFYIFAKIPAGFNQDSMAFCKDLARKNQLAIIPGTGFGVEGEGYVRLSYAASMEKLQKAMDRLTAYIQNPANKQA
ncbi:pyridoxal phosphate-dependent aminotransferase [Lactiplantibacillus nangangensis]|uniref:Aminotransferase n=1 Tax=Lactiplantibacillus nangangensis TaxID=2559917 RepID=A0ABW1SIY5_9LACO|nr:pyridoxal phosphate-dependent aminotransferase [Lactiplantibacillus nangangensis]